MKPSESQKAVIKLLLDDPSLWPEFDKLTSTMFVPHVAKIWDALKLQITNKGVVTLPTIARVSGIGEDYLKKFDGVDANPRAIDDYVANIVDDYNRTIFHEFKRGVQNADDPVHYVKTTLAEFEEKIERRLPISHISSIVDRYLARIEQRKQSPKMFWKLLSPWDSLNNATKGFYIGDYSILAARPGSGKTSLARQIRANIMREQGRSVISFLLEMTGEKLLERSIAAELGVPYSDVRDLVIFSDEVLTLKFYAIAESLRGLSWYLYGSEHNHIEDIEALVQHHMETDETLALLDIDHIGKLYAHKRTENRTQEITYVSNELRRFSTRDWLGTKTEQLHVMAVVQLNRNLEDRDDKRPRLDDIKQSGGIEEDADLVVFLYRDKMYYPDSPKYDPTTGIEVCELIIGKNRNFKPQTVELGWDGATMSFVAPPDIVANDFDLW